MAQEHPLVSDFERDKNMTIKLMEVLILELWDSSVDNLSRPKYWVIVYYV